MKEMRLKSTFLLFLVSWLLVSFSFKEEKTYHYQYYADGKIKAEGWILHNQKTAYWKFYHPNGNIERQGHYQHNQKKDYWFYYDENGGKIKEGHYHNDKMMGWWSFYKNGEMISKCEYKNHLKEGYCIIYENEKPIKALYFEADKKINEWNNYLSFVKDNSSKKPL